MHLKPYRSLYMPSQKSLGHISSHDTGLQLYFHASCLLERMEMDLGRLPGLA